MLTILVYLGGMIIIGIYCSKKNENVGDFYLAAESLAHLLRQCPQRHRI